MSHEHPFLLDMEHLGNHFAETGEREESEKKKQQHFEYYRKSLKHYDDYLSHPERFRFDSTKRQIEKDERFWVAKCMMNLFYDPQFKERLALLLQQAYGSYTDDIEVWTRFLKGENRLYFEANLPAPELYRSQFEDRGFRYGAHCVPYIQEKGDRGFDGVSGRKSSFEGPTNVDAIIINEHGFSVIIEAKVLSDMSCHTSYNMTRNQIARNIDVMLERNGSLKDTFLKHRNPFSSFFLLLTPEIFKTQPHTRHYGYVMNEYMNNGDAIERDLPHRKGREDFDPVSRRVGWLTFEDFNRFGYCPWLGKQ